VLVEYGVLSILIYSNSLLLGISNVSILLVCISLISLVTHSYDYYYLILLFLLSLLFFNLLPTFLSQEYGFHAL